MQILKQVEITYIHYKSYAETGRILGISRQRVEQILKTSQDKRVQKVKLQRQHGNHLPYCLSCRRMFGVRLKHVSHGYCGGCSNYESRSKHPQIRKLFYPKHCKDCGIRIEKGNRYNARCMTCGAKEYNSRPEVKEYKARHARKYRLTHSQEVREKSRERYQLHKDYYRNYFKKLWQEKPDVMRKRARDYYWRNRDHIIAYQKEFYKNQRLQKKLDKQQSFPYSKDRLMNGSEG